MPHQFPSKISVWSTLICGFLIVASCHSAKKAQHTITIDTIRVSANNNPMQQYREAAPRIWDITNVRVSLLLNLPERTANGNAYYTIRTTKALTGKDLNLWFDAKALHVVSVTATAGDKTLPINFKKDGDSLLIPMQAFANARFKPYSFNPKDTSHVIGIKAFDTFALQIRYVSMPYEKEAPGSAAIREARGLYFINTDNTNPEKPLQAWTQGETEANSNWLPMIDKPNERFTSEIQLTVPDSLNTLSNGALVASQKNGVLRTDTWRADYPVAAYLLTFVVGKYAKFEDRKALQKPVEYYVEPAFAPYAQGIFKHTPDMIEFFSEATGVPFPWNKYAQITVRDFVAGAMENTSASTFGDFVQKNNRELMDNDNEDIVAHELFHQWFGDYVTAESWSNITLNESFATYGEYLWQSHQHGTDYADFENREAVNAYVNLDAMREAPLARYHYRNKEEVFDRISYQKGAAILRHLQDLIGDDAMRRAMQYYLTQNAHQPGEIAQWRIAVEAASGQDMNWFFQQWYQRQGHPELSIKYRLDESAQRLWVITTQRADSGLFVLPLTAAIGYGSDLKEVTWDVKKRLDSMAIPFQNGKPPVFIPDYKGTLVGKLFDAKNAAQALQQYIASPRALKRLDALSIAAKLETKSPKDDSLVGQLVTYALDDAYPANRSYALALLETKYKSPAQQKRWKQQVIATATDDVNNTVRADAISVLAGWKCKEQLPLFKEWVYDSSYVVAGEALSAWHKFDSTGALQAARQLLNLSPRAQLKNTAWTLVGAAAQEEDLSLYTRSVAPFQFKEDLNVYWSLLNYLKNTNPLNAYKGGMNVVSLMLQSTSGSRTRTTMVNSLRTSLYNKLYGKNDAISKEKMEILKTNMKRWRTEETVPQIQKLYDDMIAGKAPKLD